MSSYTDNLKLFKYDTTADATTTFSITKALNENWDKIDAGFCTYQPVNKAGDTMSGQLTLNSSGYPLYRPSTDIQNGVTPSSNIYNNIVWCPDKNGNRFANIGTSAYVSGTHAIQMTVTNGTTYNDFTVGIDVNGKVYYNRPQIITDYISGTSGYRIWSNGYCEQWGQVANWDTITLLKKFANTNYGITACCSTYSDNGGNMSVAYKNKTVNSFVLGMRWNGAGASYAVSWRVSGYLASDQY